MLTTLAAEGEIAVLLIEQNLGVAIDGRRHVDVMVNGRIARSMPAAELAARPRAAAAAARRARGSDDRSGAAAAGAGRSVRSRAARAHGAARRR